MADETKSRLNCIYHENVFPRFQFVDMYKICFLDSITLIILQTVLLETREFSPKGVPEYQARRQFDTWFSSLMSSDVYWFDS